jgi:predicted lipoprotein with Yx(FWY)xxD motif
MPIPAGHEETRLVQARSTINAKRLGTLAAAALLFAACGGNSGGTPTGTPAGVASQVPPSSAASPGASQSAEGVEVELGDNDTLGEFLVGEGGMTLYLFTPDTTTKSNCNPGGCLENWPPFTVDGTVTGGAGVTGTFGTITRDDGTKQVTYGGHPLYYFVGDKAAGDVNGQTLNDKWYVVGADGNAITAKVTAEGGKGSY